MALKGRPSHMGGSIFVLFTVIILMVCSAPAFESNEKLDVDKNGVKFEKIREKRDEDQEAGQDAWGDQSGAHPAENESNEPETEHVAITAVKGPYLNIARSDDKPESENDGYAHKFRNWGEYLQTQKDVIRKAVSNKSMGGKSYQKESLRKPVHRPLIHTDDHFRFIDKLFKEKNYKVKAFHNLVLHKKQQEKKIKTTQRPTRQTVANAGSSSNYELELGSTTKLPV